MYSIRRLGTCMVRTTDLLSNLWLVKTYRLEEKMMEFRFVMKFKGWILIFISYFSDR